MFPLLCSALVLGWVPLQAVPLQDPAPNTRAPTPLERLEEAVALPTPKARAAAAKKLVRDKDVSLEQWQAWMASFGSFEAWEPGLHRKLVPLMIEDKVEDTELVLYVPSAYDPAKPWPLLMLLHGSGGNGLGMERSWQSMAEQSGYLLLAPTDPESGNGYAFTERERRAGMEALRWMRLQFNVDENRIHLHGVSRGGHMTWDLATRYPDRFASLVPAIGGPTWTINRGRNNMRLVENLHRTPIRDLQGSQDDAHLLRNLRQAFARLKAVGNEQALLFEFPELGHSYRTDVVKWPDFFDASVRDPLPQKLIYRNVRKEQPRDAWLRLDRYGKEVRETFPIEAPPKWASMSDFERAAFLVQMADEHTAQAVAERLEDGSFRLELTGVTRGALLLPQAWIPQDGKLVLRFGGKDKSVKVKASKEVLLLDFVERFDRRFLPVAEVPFKG